MQEPLFRDRLNPPPALEAPDVAAVLDPGIKERVEVAVREWNKRLRPMIKNAAENLSMARPNMRQTKPCNLRHVRIAGDDRQQ